MITDEEFSALITEAAETIAVPTAADDILAAARVEAHPPSLVSPIAKARKSPRRLAISAVGAAAVFAVVIGLALTSSPAPGHVAVPSARQLAPGAQAATGRYGNGGNLNEASTTGSGPTGTAPAGSQKIVTTGTLSLVVGKSVLGHVVAELQAIATSLGGYVSTSNVALAGSSRGGTVVLGIPAGEFQKAVGKAESLGTLRHLSTTATDVTGQVADLGAQVNALEAARTQLEALFARAGSIQALLLVQNEISSVQSQIQQLQAQQRVLANEISFSSLTVSLTVPITVHVAAAAPSRFSKAWNEAVSRVEGGLSTLLADSGIVLLSVLLIVLVGLLVLFGGRLLWTFLRRRLV